MFHRLRKSVSSHLEAAGINSTSAMGHSSREVTERSYIDRRIAKTVSPADVLFRLT
jgi:integrase